MFLNWLSDWLHPILTIMKSLYSIGCAFAILHSYKSTGNIELAASTLAGKKEILIFTIKQIKTI